MERKLKIWTKVKFLGIRHDLVGMGEHPFYCEQENGKIPKKLENMDWEQLDELAKTYEGKEVIVLQREDMGDGYTYLIKFKDGRLAWAIRQELRKKR